MQPSDVGSFLEDATYQVVVFDETPRQKAPKRCDAIHGFAARVRVVQSWHVALALRSQLSTDDDHIKHTTRFTR